MAIDQYGHCIEPKDPPQGGEDKQDAIESFEAKFMRIMRILQSCGCSPDVAADVALRYADAER